MTGKNSKDGIASLRDIMELKDWLVEEIEIIQQSVTKISQHVSKIEVKLAIMTAGIAIVVQVLTQVLIKVFIRSQ